MATYTQIGPDDIMDIISHYELGSLIHFESLKGGQANSSYRLKTTTGQFVISICDEKSFGEVEQLAGVLRHLEGHGFSTTRVIGTSDDRLVIEHRNKPVFIKQYLEGRVPKKMTPTRLQALGAQIARLHEIKPPKGLGDQFPYDLDRFDEILHASVDSQYKNWLKEKKEYLTQTLRTDLPRGLIHGDIFFDNTLFQGEELVAIIDFEEACHYYTLFDLGMCVTGTCGTHGLVDLSKARHLVEGYQHIRPLNKLEKEQLQFFVVYGAVVTSFWRFRQYNIVFPGSPNAKGYEAMNRIADQVHDIPGDLFFEGVFFDRPHSGQGP